MMEIMRRLQIDLLIAAKTVMAARSGFRVSVVKCSCFSIVLRLKNCEHPIGGIDFAFGPEFIQLLFCPPLERANNFGLRMKNGIFQLALDMLARSKL
ncbi:hypothetical protein CASFOL_006569 [Castilleja foliolosa]|uniref:Uncharacterized protein n=1 Tax=Castilleja foliolosa TaxID=1961234 RepID=A0ABD3E6T6_9LAMI